MTDPLDTLRPEVRRADSFLDSMACSADEEAAVKTIRAELLRLTRENAELRDGAAYTNALRLARDQAERAERAEAELAAALKANRDCVDHFEQMQAELAESRETIKRLNRRVQVAEAGVAKKVKASGGSLGRALANAAADKYMRERDMAQAELVALKARIAEPVDRSHKYVQSKEHGGCSECGYPEWEPWHRVALVKVEE